MPTIDLDQGRIHYRVTGPDSSVEPPVVFVHGLLCNSEVWTSTAAALAECGVCSYAMDLPLGSHPIALAADADLTPYGVGRLILDFLEALQLSDVTLVGNDTGTALCLYVTDTDHSRIGRLVLTDGDCFDQFPPPSLGLVFKLGRRPVGLRVLTAVQRLTALRQRAYGLNVSEPLDPALTLRWITPAGTDRGVRRDTAKFLRTVDPAELLRISNRLHDFTKPVLVLWGDADQFFPLSLGRRLAGAFANAHLVEVADGRTFFPLDHPQRVADEVRAAFRFGG
ncbi:alpha/beta fold hydrolase [Nocardia macrotermitis]|uniref:Haloalkane dehalogenase n=1 Tax=Nocardia macrotermitis TaxID=2585198 RepID=A0A7K0DA46_9NOCA|nr:alpha/beta hydrolase [Nocardia macrotermitis]MQY22558.1 Haloalkane dehalogenase [Nocardia macrotermitis]